MKNLINIEELIEKTISKAFIENGNLYLVLDNNSYIIFNANGDCSSYWSDTFNVNIFPYSVHKYSDIAVKLGISTQQELDDRFKEIKRREEQARNKEMKKKNISNT